MTMNMTRNMIFPKGREARSGVDTSNLQAVVDTGGHTKTNRNGHVKGLQQYQTPQPIAEGLVKHLRYGTNTVFDPQCAAGQFLSGFRFGTKRYGWEIDTQYEHRVDGVNRVTGNCVKIADAMLDINCMPRFDTAVANPPFGLTWGETDSTEWTFKVCTLLANQGILLANDSTIRRLGLHEHELVYRYKMLDNVFKGCDVVAGVIWWENRDFEQTTPSYLVDDYWNKIKEVVKEERRKLPPYNIWIEKDAKTKKGTLRTYLSSRTKQKRKLSTHEIRKLADIDSKHPFTLTADRETRKLLKELIESGIYTIEPEADDTIRQCIDAAESMSLPIMPITDFEAVAYADEEESLRCHTSKHGFTRGCHYELTTQTYEFKEDYTRQRIHFEESSGYTFTVEHDCRLTGQDRAIKLTDDNGVVHQFRDRPDDMPNQHPESELWEIFDKPQVKLASDVYHERVAHNSSVMDTLEMFAGFNYFPGQKDFYKRVGCKDHALVAAETGTGKTLGAITLVSMSEAKRSLIIAPQGTMKSSKKKRVTDEESPNTMIASQWVEELRRFAPYLQVFELFSIEDYHRIKALNGGKLPNGVYVSYYEAMFYNNAREKCPKSWTLDRIYEIVQDLDDDERARLKAVDKKESASVESVGQQNSDGIKCIISPSLSTLVGHEFDLVAFDEAHKLCNMQAIVTDTAIRMQPKYRYALTATPIPNIASNLFSLMGWLCVDDWYKGERCNAEWPFCRDDLPKFEELFLSKERDFTQEQMNRNANPDWTGKCEKKSPIISSPARLLKILKRTMAFISKADCNPDYVPPTVTDVRVPMGTAQQKLYAHYMDRGNIPYENPMTRAGVQISYLRGICTDPKGAEYNRAPAPIVHSNFNPKIVAILELIENLLSKGEQVVVVNSRIGVTDELARRLREAQIAYSRIDTTVSAAYHSLEANRFKQKQTAVCFMGIKCAAGHSFDQCPNLIVGSLEYSYGSFNQAVGRVDRLTSKGSSIYCILNENSIEEIMFDVVATKGDSANICLRGQRVPRDYKPVDIGEILAMSITNYNAGQTLDERHCESNWPEYLKRLTKAGKQWKSSNETLTA